MLEVFSTSEAGLNTGSAPSTSAMVTAENVVVAALRIVLFLCVWRLSLYPYSTADSRGFQVILGVLGNYFQSIFPGSPAIINRHIRGTQKCYPNFQENRFGNTVVRSGREFPTIRKYLRMKPFVYTGIDPAIFFWSLIACTVIMFGFFIYEETWSKKYWGKAGVIRVSVIILLWLTALVGQIYTDTQKKDGLKEANQKVVEFIESKGLRVVSGAVNISADTHSSVGVELPLKKDAPAGTEKDTDTCEIFAPKDVNQEIGIICGNSTNGMSLDNLLKWNEDGQPKDTKKYENASEDTKKIVESISKPEQAAVQP